MTMRNHWLDKWENEQDDKDEDFNERAAIIQFDAGMTKEDAEKLAMKIVNKKYPDSTLPLFKESI